MKKEDEKHSAVLLGELCQEKGVRKVQKRRSQSERRERERRREEEEKEES